MKRFLWRGRLGNHRFCRWRRWGRLRGPAGGGVRIYFLEEAVGEREQSHLQLHALSVDGLQTRNDSITQYVTLGAIIDNNSLALSLNINRSSFALVDVNLLLGVGDFDD